jgi:hypothetical protein
VPFGTSTQEELRLRRPVSREELNQSAPTSKSTPSDRRRRPHFLELFHLAEERGQHIPRVERNQSASSSDPYGLYPSGQPRLHQELSRPLSSGSSTGEEATEH